LGEAASAAQAGEQAADIAATQVTISVSGEALGGRLELAGARSRSGAWSGDVALSGASFAGFALSGNGVLQGQGLVPQAVIATAALRQGETPVSVAGRVSLGGSGVSFDQ